MQIGPISFGITQKDVTRANKLRESSKFVSPSVAANQDFDRITHAAVHKDEWNLQEMYYHNRISHTEPNICHRGQCMYCTHKYLNIKYIIQLLTCCKTTYT